MASEGRCIHFFSCLVLSVVSSASVGKKRSPPRGKGGIGVGEEKY